MAHQYEKYHTHHRSRRLAEWDYTSAAVYFVTICTHSRICLFGDVENGRMLLNAYGHIAAKEWKRSEVLREAVHLDAFVIMPNHVHGIVVIAPSGTDAPTNPRRYDIMSSGHARGSDMARHVASSSSKRQFGHPEAGSLGTITGAFKSAVTRRINQKRGTPSTPVWQRNYYDRIVRSEHEWRCIRAYIRTNPARWHTDIHFPRRDADK